MGAEKRGALVRGSIRMVVFVLLITTNPTVRAESLSSLRIEINIPARALVLFDHDQQIAQYEVAVGRPLYKSPVMESEIATIEWNPWWYPPASSWAKHAKVTPPGPKSPLGPVKLSLGSLIYIHGTNVEQSVGRATSHGCFRMYNRDVVALAWYLQTHVSDQTDPALLEQYAKNRRKTTSVVLLQPVPVTVVYEPVVLRGEQLFFYRDVYRMVHDWDKWVADILTRHGIDASALVHQRIVEAKEHEQFMIPVATLFQQVLEKQHIASRMDGCRLQ